MTLIEKANKIKLIICDVDGVLTDNNLYYGVDQVEPLVRFNIYDGYATVIARGCGIETAIISGRKSQTTKIRSEILGIKEIHTGILDKGNKLKEIAGRMNLDYTEIAYIGDDLIDIPALLIAGLKVCPINAVKEVKQIVDFVTNVRGGDGALRELVEFILNAQDKYKNYVQQFFTTS